VPEPFLQGALEVHRGFDAVQMEERVCGLLEPPSAAAPSPLIRPPRSWPPETVRPSSGPPRTLRCPRSQPTRPKKNKKRTGEKNKNDPGPNNGTHHACLLAIPVISLGSKDHRSMLALAVTTTCMFTSSSCHPVFTRLQYCTFLSDGTPARRLGPSVTSSISPLGLMAPQLPLWYTGGSLLLGCRDLRLERGAAGTRVVGGQEHK